MAQSSIDFLGIGADKLTNLPEFGDANASLRHLR